MDDENLLDDGIQIEVEKPVIELPGDDVDDQLDPNDPRTAIYAKRDAKLKAEMQGDAAAAPVEVPQHDDAPQTDEVKVIINGKEKLVSQARIDAAGGIVAYQKQAAASELLNQASAEARRVKEYEAALLAKEQELAQREQEFMRQAQFQTPALSDEDALLAASKEYHDALLDGDTDKASRLLLQINAARAGATVNKDEIASEAVRKARQELEFERNRKEQERFEIERQEANFDFEARFPDIADDPKLRALANQETIELQRQNPNWTPKEIIIAAAQSVRSWATERMAIPSTDQKLAAKRGATNIRGGSAVAAQRQAPPPQTKSNYVAELRKQRGLE